ncbi:MAG TPA: SCO family protein [Pirellulales bacterium]|nr:SCO family protein [Pirellulales bacterium]
MSILCSLTLPAPLAAQNRAITQNYKTPAGKSPLDGMLNEIGIDQRLGAQLPLDLEFRDEGGDKVRLGDYFHEKPVVLALVYYRCPMLCTQVLNGLLKTSQAVKFAIGRDYDVVTVSFDPHDTSELAAEKKASYVRAYRRDGAAEGWHFLTGDAESIRRLAATVGFRYVYDERTDQYAHASGIMLATPGGRLSRYLYGIEYAPNDLRLGLVESSESKIGSPVDQVLLLCYHYDPLTGKYGLAISGALRAAGSATMLFLGGFLVVMFRQERRRQRLVRLPLPLGEGRGEGAASTKIYGPHPHPLPKGEGISGLPLPRGEGRGEGAASRSVLPETTSPHPNPLSEGEGTEP